MLRGYDTQAAADFDCYSVLCILREMLTGGGGSAAVLEEAVRAQLRAMKLPSLRKLARDYDIETRGKVREDLVASGDVLLAALHSGSANLPEVRIPVQIL